MQTGLALSATDVSAHISNIFAEAALHGSQPGADTITGLPNRALLEWYLDQLFSNESETGKYAAVLVVELNEVRAMRYAFGGTVCDRFVHVISQRIRSLPNQGQFIASLSGDELAIVISKCDGFEDSAATARALLACVREGVMLEGREYFTSANIGIALADQHFDTPSEILRRAQAVLHEARIEGTGMIKFACDESVRNASEDLQMLNDVHNACQRGEFHVEYQPIFDLRSGRIKSLEALLRWNSPEFGLVPPDRFIPLLEQCGAIHEVGDWVFADACRQAKLWNESSTAPIRVAVNVSAVQFESDDFELRLFRILNQWNCRPTWIELEITESTAIKMVAKMKDRLTSIAERGITLAIDDFGAGYSSFGHLAEMPVHHLKLDRALMSKLPNDRKGAAIVKAIQALSESLGLTLTVEGIERRDQQNFCEEAGLNLVQGFLLGMPALAADITRALGEPQAEFDFA